MKILKKISLVYFLQLVAVVLLFSYKDAAPPNEKNELETGKPSALMISADSLLLNKSTYLPKLYVGKGW